MQTPFLKYFFTVTAALFLSFWVNPEDSEMLSFSFYSEYIELPYNQDFVQSFQGTLEENNIVSFYESLTESQYESLLHRLNSYKHQLGLNDWLVYEMVQKAIADIYKTGTKQEKTLAEWFLLSKLGYDTRLAFLKKEVFIYVRTLDDIYETPLIEENGQRYVGLTEIQYKRTASNKAIYLLNFLAAPNGKPFSFSLTQLPNLKPSISKKKLTFDWRDHTYQVDINCDRTLVNMMKTYPVIAESSYIETPFSKTLKKSLLPQIKTIIADKTLHEALEIISTFTRSAFRYKEDEKYFGRSKPMIRDEVFFYPYSDCEDRSAVFFGIVEELLNLPMIIVAFPDHLTVAVALDEPIGPSIRYKGKKFYICDPTGPFNSSQIGTIPKGYERQSFEILMDNL